MPLWLIQASRRTRIVLGLIALALLIMGICDNPLDLDDT